MTYIVVLGLVVVVVLVVVLVALGLRAGRSSREEDDWIPEERPRGRRASAHDEDDELDQAYGTGYDPGYDRRVAGAPLSPPPPAPSASAAAGHGRPTEKMDDDDYWATITFDKPKFPWQHDTENDKGRSAAPDPLDEQIAEQPPAAPKPTPLTAPSMAAGQQDYSVQPSQQLRPIDPLDGSLPTPSAPATRVAGNDPLTGRSPLIGSDPLGLPMTRADSHDPESTQVFSGEPLTSSYGDNSYSDNSYSSTSGGGGTGSYGGSAPGAYGTAAPTSYGGAGTPPSSSNMPSSSNITNPPGMSSSSGSSGSSGSMGDTDSHRLPTVDELLQRIQADRRKSGTSSTPSASSAPSAPASAPLGDPLNDPLGSTGPMSNTGPMSISSSPGNSSPSPSPGDSGYGSSGSWSAAASATPHGFATDPLGIGQLPVNALPSSGPGGPGPGGPGGSGGSRYGSAAGQGHSSDAYPPASVYGEAPRYDDPLGGYSNSYGSLGMNPGQAQPQSLPPTADEPGRYADLTGSGYGGGPANDPLGTGGYGVGSGGGSGPTYYGSPPPAAESGYGPPHEQSYGLPAGDPGQPYPPNVYGTPAYGPGPGHGPGYGHPEPSAQPQPQQRGGDDWDSYRDFRS